MFNTFSCIYAQNTTQNQPSFIYVSTNVKISGLEAIHIENKPTLKSKDTKILENNAIFNSSQIYVSQSTFIHFNADETSINKTLSCISNTIKNNKTANFISIKSFETIKTNSKATSNFKAITPFNNSPFGLYAYGFNKIAISTTNHILSKKKEFLLDYSSITNSTEQLISSNTNIINQQDIYTIEKHFFKYSFSLPPPIFC